MGKIAILFSIISLFLCSCSKAEEVGFIVKGIDLTQSEFCREQECVLVNTEPPVSKNGITMSVETYNIKKMGNLYFIDQIKIINNDKQSNKIDIGFEMRSSFAVSTEIEKNIKIYLKSAFGIEASENFSRENCKTFDQFLLNMSQTGLSMPEQGTKINLNEEKYSLVCLVLPLADNIHPSLRDRYPKISITVNKMEK